MEAAPARISVFRTSNQRTSATVDWLQPTLEQEQVTPLRIPVVYQSSPLCPSCLRDRTSAKSITSWHSLRSLTEEGIPLHSPVVQRNPIDYTSRLVAHLILDGSVQATAFLLQKRRRKLKISGVYGSAGRRFLLQ